jgi:hypothetical protein
MFNRPGRMLDEAAPEMPETPCTGVPPSVCSSGGQARTSRAHGERDVAAYWDRLNPVKRQRIGYFRVALVGPTRTRRGQGRPFVAREVISRRSPSRHCKDAQGAASAS